MSAYSLRYDGAWRLDRRSLERALTPRTRAILVASPSCPTGALLSGKDLAYLDALCARHGLALVGDERFADTALEPAPSVAMAERCLAFHLSSARSVCGAPLLDVGWLALGGPERLVGPALRRIQAVAGTRPPATARAQRALLALLARQGSFLGPLRARVTRNRAALATSALREAPWTLLSSGGGWWGVLQIGAANEEEAVCLALLDEGVVIHPGFLYGLEPGHLVLSLLPRPESFQDGLERLDACLRRPL